MPSETYSISEEELFEFLSRRYVQRADNRQKKMGLVYMECETHDLSKELFKYINKEIDSIIANRIFSLIGLVGEEMVKFSKMKNEESSHDDEEDGLEFL